LFLAMVDSLPQARSHVFRALAAHARAQQARLLLAAMPNGRHRVAWWLTRQAPGPPAGPRPGLVRLPGGQSGLAHVLGLTRVTVNRALKALEREGTIRVAAHGIEISDPEGLARHVEM
jgi:CRP/FNR family transcriptional regulator